jgi:hypothetical protein
MSVLQSPVRPSAVPLAALASGSLIDAGFDARWESWLDRGRRHDVAVQRRLRIALFAAAPVIPLIAYLIRVAAGAR